MMDPPFKFPASPGTPLFPLSPERVNGTRSPYSSHTSQSPSMPEFGKPSQLGSGKPKMGSTSVDPFVFTTASPKSSFRHSRNNSTSDALVQGMVARFDSMSITDYKAKTDLLIKRVEASRELAELGNRKLIEEAAARDAEVKKIREDARQIKKELDDCRERERKSSKRVDVLMDDLHLAKETHSHTVAAYEKEIRRTRKEAFKFSSSLLKIQEELKATRNTFKINQANLESERAKSSKREQDAFTAQYQLIGVQEQLQMAQERIEVLEAERDGLKTSLKEEEISRIALEGRIALPPAEEDDDNDLLASPVKSPRKKILTSDSEDKENAMPKKAVALKSLQEELATERRRRQDAQDQIEFMKMECQFQCCSCRIAEQQGHSYVHDGKYEAEMERIKTSVPLADYSMSMDQSIANYIVDESLPAATELQFDQTLGTFQNLDDEWAIVDSKQPVDSPMEDELISIEPLITDVFVSPRSDDVEMSHTLMPDSDSDTPSDPEDMEGPESPREIQPPYSPVHREVRTVTTTTIIPITFTPVKPAAQPAQPPRTPSTVGHAPSISQGAASPFPSRALKADGTIDREAALELIRQRRGRAKSVALGQATPKRQMVQGNVRRDISAPALKAWAKH